MMDSPRISVEKNGYASDWSEDIESGSQHSLKTTWWKSQLESFKPVPTRPLSAGIDRYERAVNGVVGVKLRKGIKPRHIHMIALCGAIGSGLFVSTGRTIYCAGPGGLLIGFTALSLIMLVTMNSAAELAVEYPTAGAFSAHASRFVDYSWGFTIGWMYTLQSLLTVPTELNAASILVSYMGSPHTHDLAMGMTAVFLVVIFLLHLLDVRIFGEIEFAMCTFKLLVILIFIICGVLIICGVNNDRYVYGTQFFVEPGAFMQGAKGVCSIFIGCSWAYLGTEISILTTAETEHAQLTMPRVVRQVFWRCLILHIACAMVLSCLVAYNNVNLIRNSKNSVVFMIAINLMGNNGLTWFFRIAIILSLLSSAYTSIYASTRTIVCLAAQGHAPKFLGKIDQKGRPLPALALAFLFGFIGFAAPIQGSADAFSWLANFEGVIGLTMWLSINIHHIRFRLASKTQGYPLDGLLYKSIFGITGSIVTAGTIAVIFGLQFWTALCSSDQYVGTSPVFLHFLKVFLGMIVVLVVFIVHKAMFRDRAIKLTEIDLCNGRRSQDLEAERIAAMVERQYIKDQSWLYRGYRLWC